MNIDHRLHVEPAKNTQQVLRSRLGQRFGTERGAEIWERVISIYEGFVAELPYTGGARNIHAHSIYDSIFLFAYWEAQPEAERETPDEFRRTVALVFNGSEGPSEEGSAEAPKGGFPVARALQTVVNHAPWVMRPVAPAVRAAFALESHMVRTGQWHNAWITKVNDPLPEGCLLHVELVGCPIADFAQSHGYAHLMPAMCNPDFDLMEPIGIHYVRPTTVAMGYPTCDNYFYPAGSPEAEASPVRTSADGFLYNELPPAQVEPKIPLQWRYYNVIAPVLRRSIRKRYGYELATECYHAARPIYQQLIAEAPEIGAGNPMATNIYTSFVVFAFYRAGDGRLTPEMLRACIADIVDGLPIDFLSRFADLGRPAMARTMNKKLRGSAEWAEARPTIKQATWDFHFDDDPASGMDERRVHYHFTHCPINDFARSHDLLDVLPVLCELDHVTARLVRTQLTREHTLATDGPVCDYLFEPTRQRSGASEAERYKELSVAEFTKAAEVYDSGHAGIYELCKDDYPPILEELRSEPFADLLDVGCGTGPMVELLSAEYPEARLTGLDLTPRMIEAAQAKALPNATFVVGDAEDLPFADGSFDAVICANSFHHYPHPEAFLASVARVLRPSGRLILRDYTSNALMVWLMNHIEMPLANLIGHGDYGVRTVADNRALAEAAGLTVEKAEAQAKFRLHLVARKG